VSDPFHRRHHRAAAKRRDPVIPIGWALTSLSGMAGTSPAMTGGNAVKNNQRIMR
jgi:hypothetical protein